MSITIVIRSIIVIKNHNYHDHNQSWSTFIIIITTSFIKALRTIPAIRMKVANVDIITTRAMIDIKATIITKTVLISKSYWQYKISKYISEQMT